MTNEQQTDELSPICPACRSISGAHTDTIQHATFKILRCGQCGLRFVPSSQLVNVNYDELYRNDGSYAHHVRELESLKAGILPRFSHARRLAIDELTRERPKTLLEIGCGVGNFLAWVRHLGIQGYGIDSSSNAIEIARQHLTFPLQADLFNESIFPSVNFDAICTWEVLEHVQDVRSFLHTAYSRLNAGGRLFLSTPNAGSRWVLGDIGKDVRATPPVHVTFWDTGSLERALREVGFQDVKISLRSIPLNSARRSEKRLATPRVILDSFFRPSQRMTLLAIARKHS